MNIYLQKAIEIVGSQNKLAKHLDVSQNAVFYWLNNSINGIPPQHCIAIERLTKGKVTAAQLLPDFPWKHVKK